IRWRAPWAGPRTASTPRARIVLIFTRPPVERRNPMDLDRWFRLSCYLTLGLSCAALVFAESFFLPGLSVCLAPVLALVLLGWWVEGRWSLSVRGANFLGLIIAAGGVTWLVTQVLDEDSLLSRVSPHLALVPYMGPLVMAALLVQVFRPRQRGDFWRLQGL